MRNIFLSLLAVGFMAAFAACTTEEGRQARAYEQVKTEEHYIRQQIASGAEPFELTGRTEGLITYYKDFQENYPEHEEAAEFLFQAGITSAELLGEYQQAVRLMKEVQQEYPDRRIGERSLFMAGFMYDYQMDEPEMAREVYSKFLNTYPQSEMADEVRRAREVSGSERDHAVPDLPQPQP